MSRPARRARGACSTVAANLSPTVLLVVAVRQLCRIRRRLQEPGGRLRNERPVERQLPQSALATALDLGFEPRAGCLVGTALMLVPARRLPSQRQPRRVVRTGGGPHRGSCELKATAVGDVDAFANELRLADIAIRWDSDGHETGDPADIRGRVNPAAARVAF
jgi:hypothetical protein